LIQRVIDGYKGAAGGFYTREIRHDGVRKGFEIVTLDGRRGVLAHVDIKGQPRVGKYGVDMGVMEGLAARAMSQAAEQGALVVVDEIGPMEILSSVFCETLVKVLDMRVPLLGTIVQRRLPFSDRVKRRQDVQLIEVHAGNQDELVETILAHLNYP